MSQKLLNQIISDYAESFSDTEQKLADYFLTLGSELTTKTIAQLSNETGISQTSIFNFVKKLGFKGFQQFKIQIASNQSTQNTFSSLPYNSEIRPNDSSEQVAHKIINSNMNSMNTLKNELSIAALDHTIETILDSERLHFFGSGGSSILALDAYHKFIRAPFPCNYIFDAHMQLSYSTKLNEKDCVFLFSHSGLSKETVALAKQLARQHAKIILFTANSDSLLNQYAYERFNIPTEESIFKNESLTSRNLYLTVIDIIYTNVMYKDEDYNQKSMDNIRDALADVKFSEDHFSV